jgi:hypothetical protein
MVDLRVTHSPGYMAGDLLSGQRIAADVAFADTTSALRARAISAGVVRATSEGSGVEGDGISEALGRAGGGAPI